jgi:hypothetical protein
MRQVVTQLVQRLRASEEGAVGEQQVGAPQARLTAATSPQPADTSSTDTAAGFLRSVVSAAIEQGGSEQSLSDAQLALEKHVHGLATQEAAVRIATADSHVRMAQHDMDMQAQQHQAQLEEYAQRIAQSQGTVDAHPDAAPTPTPSPDAPARPGVMQASAAKEEQHSELERQGLPEVAPTLHRALEPEAELRPQDDSSVAPEPSSSSSRADDTAVIATAGGMEAGLLGAAPLEEAPPSSTARTGHRSGAVATEECGTSTEGLSLMPPPPPVPAMCTEALGELSSAMAAIERDSNMPDASTDESGEMWSLLLAATGGVRALASHSHRISVVVVVVVVVVWPSLCPCVPVCPSD